MMGPNPCFCLAAVDGSLGEKLLRLITFQDYNTWVPLVTTALLGCCAGVVGVFLVLRGRALVGDVIGHAALPGIGLAFLVLELHAPGTGRSTPALLAGALASGLLGAASVLLMDRYSRAKADAALAIAVSLFYGAGIVLLSVVQRLGSGSQAGLKNYLSGKAASLIASDAVLTAVLTGIVLAVTVALFKEWTLLCFDDAYAQSQGYPVLWLDALLIGLAAVVAVLGMQSVGLVLVVAMLIIPPAAARFWTDNIRRMALLAGLMGGLSGALGVAASSLGPRIATGPTIVLCATAMFLVSLFLGLRRGLVWRHLG